MANLRTFALVEVPDAENPTVGDLRLKNGHLVELEGHEAIAQKIRIRLRFFKGEWYLDKRQGIPYWTRVLVKNPDLPGIESMFRRVIAGTPGVAVVNRLNITFDTATRASTIAFTATTDDGVVIEQEPFLVPFPQED
jgi:hypothetical protein